MKDESLYEVVQVLEAIINKKNERIKYLEELNAIYEERLNVVTNKRIGSDFVGGKSVTIRITTKTLPATYYQIREVIRDE